MTAAADLECWNCGASLDELPRPITRHMNCPACFEDLHCCRMCRHYRGDATSPCDDERAEPPVYKEGANFCDFFRPASRGYRTGRRERQAQAKSRFAALFAPDDAEQPPNAAAADADQDDADDPGAADAASAARRKLEDLFR